MGSDAKHPIRVEQKPGFKETYRSFARQHPEINDRMRTFNDNKKHDPPIPLPRGMKDHQLKGGFHGIRECHLADDIITTICTRRGAK
jgi:mRNA-degrading endonuclease YafQ of YafQ-DinJ toxin-antitoxin module